MLLSNAVVRVPGSTSNCGAGFDTLGLALSLYNRISVTRTAAVGAQPETEGDRLGLAMVESAARAFFAAAAQPAHGFVYHVEGDVPTARGLGSSVTVLAGVVAGLNALAGEPLSREAIVEVVTALEGHPDNASAGVLGGFCVARCDPETGRYQGCLRFDVPPEISFVVASPSVEVMTKESRGALPATLPYFDAVRSINSAAYVVAAFAARDYARLRHAVGDYMHEPYRLPGIPGGRAAIAAGVDAGAFAGWLSGSGSSVLCVAPQEAAAGVGQAMAAAFAAAGIPSQLRVLTADNEGLSVQSA